MKRMFHRFLGLTVAIMLLLTSVSGAFAQGDELSGTITVCVLARAGAQEAWEAVSKAYMQMHPNVNIALDLKANDGYGDWITNVGLLENPDVDIAEFFSAAFDHSRLLVLSDYIDLDSPYSDGTWGDQIETNALTTSSVTGEQVCLSMFSTQVMWIYNRDIFEKVGVEPPATWDEFVEVCEKLSAAGYRPIATSYDTAFGSGWLPWIYLDQSTRPLINLYRAHEGDFCYDPDVDGVWEYDPTDPWNDDEDKVNQNIVRVLAAVRDGDYALNTPGYKTAWTNFSKIFPAYAGGDAFFAQQGSDGIDDAFYKQEAAMTLQGGWALISFQRTLDEVKESGIYTDEEGNQVESTGFELGTFVMPTMSGEGLAADARSIEVPTSGFSVLNKDQAHNDLVVDFLMYYTSVEGMSLYVDSLLEAGGALDGPILVKGVEFPSHYAPLYENLKSIGNCQKGYGHIFAVGVPAVEESAREFKNAAYEFLNGRTDVDTFLNLAEENVKTYLPILQQIVNISDEDLNNPASAPVGY